jgi:hypothetical protein
MRIFLVSLLSIMAMPFGANAFSTDTELCFTGSGSHRIDIDVCSWALREEIPSPLTHATLLIRRGKAFLSGKIYELACKISVVPCLIIRRRARRINCAAIHSLKMEIIA